MMKTLCHCKTNTITLKRTAAVPRNVTCVCAKKDPSKQVEVLHKSLQIARDNALMLSNLVPTANVCKAAWDRVWDLEQAYYKTKEQLQIVTLDPLIEYCAENPEADECREYDV